MPSHESVFENPCIGPPDSLKKERIISFLKIKRQMATGGGGK
jgi:hypothetical protein